MVLPPGVMLAASMAERRVTVWWVPLIAPVAGLTPDARLRSARLLTWKTVGTVRSSKCSRLRWARRGETRTAVRREANAARNQRGKRLFMETVPFRWEIRAMKFGPLTFQWACL